MEPTAETTTGSAAPLAPGEPDRTHAGEHPGAILDHGPVRLRRWRAADADASYRVAVESLARLRPWMRWAANGYEPADAAAYTVACERDWADGTAYNYAITLRHDRAADQEPDGAGAVAAAGTVVGSCGLMRRIGPGGLEIGYWLHPAHTGRGLATAATAALVTAAFTLPGVDRVEIVHDAANTPSGAIPHRLGFAEVRRGPSRPQFTAPEGSGVDVVWRVTADQWGNADGR